jgi:Lar family restriction alleviation protein
MATELKPCPFCGNNAKGQMNFNGVRVYITEDENRFYVQCDTCGSRTAEKTTPEKAEAVWNMRAEE